MKNVDVSKHLDEIAIVGMAGRFPGAHNVDEFWRNLRDGVESITFYSEDELLAAGIDRETLNNKNYIRAGATLPDVDLFDASFFGFTPREAEVTIRKAMDELVQLNQGHKFSYDRETLIKMLDEALAKVK